MWSTILLAFILSFSVLLHLFPKTMVYGFVLCNIRFKNKIPDLVLIALKNQRKLGGKHLMSPKKLKHLEMYYAKYGVPFQVFDYFKESRIPKEYELKMFKKAKDHYLTIFGISRYLDLIPKEELTYEIIESIIEGNFFIREEELYKKLEENKTPEEMLTICSRHLVLANYISKKRQDDFFTKPKLQNA